jgi:phage baseplate assembly protein V
MNNSYVFSEIARRLNNIVRFGTVAEVDTNKARIRVKIGKITTTWIPWLTTAGSVKLWNPPAIGEQVFVVSQGGDLSVSVAIPSIFQSKFAAPGNDENVIQLELSNKTSIEFNKKNNEFSVKIEDSELVFDNETFKAKIGEVDAEIKDGSVKLIVGSSKLEITAEKISLHAAVIDAPNLKVAM